MTLQQLGAAIDFAPAPTCAHFTSGSHESNVTAVLAIAPSSERADRRLSAASRGDVDDGVKKSRNGVFCSRRIHQR
jgi:hypothetical protein